MVVGTGFSGRVDAAVVGSAAAFVGSSTRGWMMTKALRSRLDSALYCWGMLTLSLAGVCQKAAEAGFTTLLVCDSAGRPFDSIPL